MGLIEGMFKYMIFMPLTLVGFVCMYTFGGGLITLSKTWMYIFEGNFLEAALEYFFRRALPPTSLEHVLFQVFIGTVIAGLKWFIGMSLYFGMKQ